MGTDIHLEAEAKVSEGLWVRIPHAPEPCWSCGVYDRKTGAYLHQSGEKHVICMREEMQPDDVVIDELREGWVRLARTEPCLHCNGTKFHHPQFLQDRNYDVFSILANVRNGYGFAGVVTSSGFEPIAPGRGLPDDLSQEIRDHLKRIGYDVVDGELEYHRDGEEEDDIYEVLERERDGYWSLGEHSLTWVLLSEILDYDWTRTVWRAGWVDPVEFQHYREHGHPNSWSGGVSGQAVEHLTEMDMAAKIDSGDIVFHEVEQDEFEKTLGLPPRKTYTTSLQRAMGEWDLPEGSVGASIRDRTSLYCPIKWEVRYAECVSATFWQEIEYLKSVAPDGDPANVRLVMGFDS